MNFYRPDAWTMTHTFGSYFLTRLLSHLPFPYEPLMNAAIIAFGLGVLWELAVDDRKLLPFLRPDPRGVDGTDIIADALGCLIAIWI